MQLKHRNLKNYRLTIRATPIYINFQGFAEIPDALAQYLLGSPEWQDPQSIPEPEPKPKPEPEPEPEPESEPEPEPESAPIQRISTYDAIELTDTDPELPSLLEKAPKQKKTSKTKSQPEPAVHVDNTWTKTNLLGLAEQLRLPAKPKMTKAQLIRLINKT